MSQEVVQKCVAILLLNESTIVIVISSNSMEVCVRGDTGLGVVWLITLGGVQRSGPHAEYTYQPHYNRTIRHARYDGNAPEGALLPTFSSSIYTEVSQWSEICGYDRANDFGQNERLPTQELCRCKGVAPLCHLLRCLIKN